MKSRMYILGISGGVSIGNQDGSAALLKDGQLLFACEEERLSGIKHAPGTLPKNAIQQCLSFASIDIHHIDAVVFAGETYQNIVSILQTFFELHFGYAPPIKLVNHHLAHAASAYFNSGFEKALILTCDQSGDRISTMISYGQGNDLKCLKVFNKPNSLGIFYSAITQYLGFDKDSDEYKVMGMAAYGRPTVDLSWFIHPDPTEGYQLNFKYLRHFMNPSLPGPSRQQPLFQNLELKKSPRLKEEKIEQYHFDVAASAQKQLEKILVHLIHLYLSKVETKNICLAGGVALNCLANQTIRESGLISNLYVPPVASDAGLSLGAAILETINCNIPYEPIQHTYWGLEYSNSCIETVLKRAKANYSLKENICHQAAKDLMEGKILCWFQGRSEFGPRALGNRSILADPRDPTMIGKINNLVKFRESFRPFAPSILKEKAHHYFKDCYESPYMTQTYTALEITKKLAPAICHRDGTARVHTVEHSINPKFYQLIKLFEQKTNLPLILNTSLNAYHHPMNGTPEQALATFYSTGADCLALGDYYLTK